ncbi:DUF1295-domain-containing protein [Mycena sanguinolenta]|uniref:DUF1295-domain-containing protein n=1 Tax=Mycena sanguinolenta TaxID=230812 RepID=A0A8H6Z4I6_9AGAR|nr:DUF1295-domain-containing protein [Mycena sanguinolenta]
MPVHALDSHYLALTILITTGYQLTGFFIAYTLQFDKITDFTGGSNFFILALVTLLCGGTFHARNVVASILVMVWAVRIAGFLLLRVLKTGHDGRFDDIRKSFLKFLAFWIGQTPCFPSYVADDGEPFVRPDSMGALFASFVPRWQLIRVKVWVVSLPVVILNSPAVSDVEHGGSNPPFGTSRDIAGIVLWSLGFFIEATADMQKFLYKFSKTTSKDKAINTGLWAWSRNPPYFGEMMCWWGIWILCLSPSTNGTLSSSSRSAQYAAIMSPIFTVIILMFGSGLPTSTKPQAKRFYLKSYGPEAHADDAFIWEQYKAHLRRTSILIPLPPAIYKHVPSVLKKTLLLDFPMYQFNEQKDGPPAIEEAKKTADWREQQP